METRQLEKSFEGRGEVRGFTYNQLLSSDGGYIYEVIDNENSKWKHYEVFERKIVHQFDFETNTQLDSTKEVYPKSNDFGKWAWTTRTIKAAEGILNLISYDYENRRVRQDNNQQV